jgi:hypothetical protein
LLENRGFPASTDDADGGFYRTEFSKLRHNEPSVIVYTTYRLVVTYSDVTMIASLSSILTTKTSGLNF